MLESGNKRAIVVATGCCLILASVIGLYYCLSLSVVPMSEGLGVKVGSITLIFTLAAASATVTTVLIGRILKLLNGRRAAILGIFLVAAAYVIWGMSDSLYLTYAAALFLFGPGVILGGYVLTQIIIAKWFIKGRGFVTGVSGACDAAGTAILSPIIGSIIASFGYRAAMFTSAGIVLVIGLIAAVFMVRETPEELGMRPFGADETYLAGSNKDDHDGAADLNIPGILAKDAIKTLRFWAIIAAAFLVASALQGAAVQQSAVLAFKGFDTMTIALCLSVYSIANTINKFLFGAVSDRFGVTAGVNYCCVAVAIGVMLILTGNSLTIAVAFSILLGLGPAASSMLTILTVVPMYGRRDIASLQAYSHTATSLGSMVGPAIVGFTFNATNSYNVSFTTLAAMCILSAVLMSIFVRKKYYFKEEVHLEV